MAAKAKKATVLTPEEKLNNALVPVDQQPYPVPENWCWTYIKAGFDVTSSKRVHKSDWLSEGIPFYRTRELVKLSEQGSVENELFISNDLYENLKSEYGIPTIDDILISGVGTIGIPYIVKTNKPFYFKDGNVIWFKNKGLFLSTFIYYLYKSVFISNQIHDMSAGTTVDTYTIINANRTVLPLPPLAEQHRIVSRIESLFAKLDEVKEKAQAVVDGYEDRKAAILHKAFIGELTAKWRKEHGVSIESWLKTTVKDVCKDIKVGIVIKPSQYYTDKNNGFAAFRSANVREFHIDDFDWVYLNDNGMKLNQRSIVHTGDVLVVRSGNPGTACVVDDRFDGFNAIDILIAVPDKAKITSHFLCAYTNSPIGRHLVAANKRGMALAHFNVGGYSKLSIALPSLDEQNLISEYIIELLSKEDQIKSAAESVIDQIDIMKKSILARSFRGELGTNDPADEPAIELLKRVLE